MFRTIVRLFVLVFAVPAFAAEPIPNVTAKATSEQVKTLFGPENLCNNHGLSANGELTTNGYADGGSMWHTGYLKRGSDEHPIVEFDLGRVYTVGRFRVWNQNGTPHRGFHHVSMMISDDGRTWRAIRQRFQFAKAPGTNDYRGEEYQFTPTVRGRYLRFFCDSTHRTGGNPELAGLGKVRFYESTTAPTPEPNDEVFPAGVGVINVKQAPYFAKGDGVTDDTAALQRAIDDWQGTRRIVYLPRGTYRVSQSLRYTPGKGHGYNTLRGGGMKLTTIQLKDNTFTDPTKPQAVLSLAFNGQPDGKGVHADWFNNNVGDLTIDTGHGNSGAIGLQYYSNNVGAARNITIRGGGVIGLDLGYADQNGPCLVKNIRIEGFTTGVRSGATVNSQTAEQITVLAANVGWHNRGQCLAIRKLNVQSTGLGFQNDFGVAALVDSEFRWSGVSGIAGPAIQNGETLFARNIEVGARVTAIENTRKTDTATPNAKGEHVAEWVSTPPLTLFPHARPRSLNLPVEETPETFEELPNNWVNIRAFRKLDDADDSAALQRAIDSGAATIDFPNGGHFVFGSVVELKPTLKRIAGCFASAMSVNRESIVWRVVGDGPPLFIEDVVGHVKLDHTAKRTVVIRNTQGLDGKTTGCGDLFLENVVGEWDFHGGRTWARQFNTEREGTHASNTGGSLWILGLKTERGGTLIDTQRGKTEVIGGLCYTTTKGKLAPMFSSVDSEVSYTLGEVCYSGDPYTQIVRERRGDTTKAADRQAVPLRPSFLNGSQLPLFVGRP